MYLYNENMSFIIFYSSICAADIICGVFAISHKKKDISVVKIAQNMSFSKFKVAFLCNDQIIKGLSCKTNLYMVCLSLSQ